MARIALIVRRSAAVLGLLCSLCLTGCVTTIETTAADGTKQSKTYMPWEAPPQSGDNQARVSNSTNLSYARLQEDRGQTSEARALYEKVLRQDPRSSEAMMGIARLDQLAGRTGEAEQHFVRAVNADPNNPRPIAALGAFYAENKRWNESIRLLNQATQKAPDDKNYRYQLGVALAKSGQVREALPHFVQSVGPASAHFNIAVIMHENGDLAGAEDNLVLALTKNPELERAQLWLDQVRREKETQLASSSGRPVYRPASAAIAGNARGNVTTASPAMSGRPNNAVAARTASSSSPVASGRASKQQFAPPARSASYARTTGNSRSVAPANSIPASAGHNPPPGVTEEQWEQWSNQQKAAPVGYSAPAGQ